MVAAGRARWRRSSFCYIPHMSPAEFDLWLRDDRRAPLVMGVLNVTPDSFSDGGRFIDPAAAVARAEVMAAEGADLIDVGGESTRPGSLPVEPAEQIRRVVPVLRAARARLPGVTFSIDTTRAEVAAAALDAGAHVINDVSAGRSDPALLPLAARRGCPVVLMHMQGTPQTMQLNPTYSDVTTEVATFLRDRLAAAVDAGVDPSSVLLDPGIGFGKTVRHNLQLLQRLGELAAIGRPLVVGTSRKGFIGKVLGEKRGSAPAPTDGGPAAAAESSSRLFGTAATVAWVVANGAGVVRVHDIGPMSQVVRMVRSIKRGGD
jgi:dihydropteroate synthase